MVMLNGRVVMGFNRVFGHFVGNDSLRMSLVTSESSREGQ